MLLFRATSKANTLIREAQNQLAASSIPSLTLTQPTTPQTPLPAQVASPMVEDATNDLQIVDENGQPVDWQNDPNEPRYCLCNQVSYGDMVGCDNDDVSIKKLLCDKKFWVDIIFRMGLYLNGMTKTWITL